MPTTLPQWTKDLDDLFVNTWYEIRAQVIDNVSTATVLAFALRQFGSMKTQIGSEIVTDTVGYGQKAVQRFGRGSTLTQTIIPLDTMAEWDWAYFTADVNRSLIDDSTNAGKFKIKDYLMRRLEAARTALVEGFDDFCFQWQKYYISSEKNQPNGIYDICPNATAESAVGTGRASDSKVSGTTNGKITRANPWWKNWTMANGATASSTAQDVLKNAGPTNEPYSLNLVPDMRHMFNKIRSNQEAPNFILMDGDIYEAYEDEAEDKRQIVASRFTREAIDLGFDAYTFKGSTMSYSDKLTGSLHVFMLNMNYVNCWYDPNLWYDMDEWKSTPLQFDKVAFIVSKTTGLTTPQPRRHGVMEYAN